MAKSVLVIFDKDYPKRSDSWWNQFDTLIAPIQLEKKAEDHNLSFQKIDDFINAGNIQEASELLRDLSFLTDSNGQRISKFIKYEGFELWWMHYNTLMYKFCLPYTQYRLLLEHLKDYSMVYLEAPPFPGLFQYFLDSCKCKYTITDKFRSGISIGILFQVGLSALFLIWLKIRNPKLLIWTSDLFDPPRDHDFRMRFIYEELRYKKINFVEFIRSMEPSIVVLQHAWKRKRPVIYSYAVVITMRGLANFFRKSTKINTRGDFWSLVAADSLRNVTGDIWAIRVLQFIIEFIGIRVAIIDSANNRNFHEVLACKLLSIDVIGIQHGASPGYYLASEFMPGFDGEKYLSVDKYGLWSDWWKQHYIKHSRAYRPEQLYVAGLMRPLLEGDITNKQVNKLDKQDNAIKVLFVSEQLTPPVEAMLYLLRLINAKNIRVYIKFRPYSDSFEEWLKKNDPGVLSKVKILRGNIHNAIAECDVAVGAYSTAVLEAALQLKPLILFRTKKWGDCFELKSFDQNHCLFAEDPEELMVCINRSGKIPKEILKKLQERFFGNPYQNGSKWVVEQAQSRL